MRVERIINGNMEQGRRPYIQYENVHYRNEVLSCTPDLIGKKVSLIVNIDDLRVIKAFLQDGSELGYLTATGKWGITPHTLKTRQQIFKLKRQKMIHFLSNDDPIEIYQSYLQNKAKTNKRARNKIAEMKLRNMEETGTEEFENENNKQDNPKPDIPKDFKSNQPIEKDQGYKSDLRKIRKTFNL